MNDKMREALEAALADITTTAQIQCSQYRRKDKTYLFNDELWASRAPGSFAVAQQCRAALAQAPPSRPVSGEPVAWVVFADNGNCRIWFANHADAEKYAQAHADDAGFKLTPLYTAPPATAGREEIAQVLREKLSAVVDHDGFARVQGIGFATDAILALGPTLTPQDGNTVSIDLMSRIWANLFYDEEEAGNTFQHTINEVVDWLAARNALPSRDCFPVLTTPPAPGADRAAVIEECAAIAENFETGRKWSADDDMQNQGYYTEGVVADEIAAAIRSLAPKGAA